jgi:hypothetical protein
VAESESIDVRGDLPAWMKRTADPLVDAYRKHLSDRPL